MKKTGATVALAMTLLLSASPASAQRNGRGRARLVQPAPDPSRRQALEQQFRQRSEEVVRKKLNLSDEQATRLRSVNATIGAQRNALIEQERAVRTGLRDEMAKGNGADQRRVAQLMAQAHDLQGRRFALQQAEQQQLSGFMSPVQVAQYIGLQAQIRQRMRDMLKNGGNPGGEP